MSEPVTVELLKGFLDAFNRHDLDSIMGYFADECMFYRPRGVDLLEFVDGKIIRKDSFWKIHGMTR